MIKLVCLDMDGTIIMNNGLIEGASKFFDFLHDNNVNFVFITNNSSKSIGSYVKKMNGLSVVCDEKNFYTSVEVTIKYMKSKEYKSFYSIGTEDFKRRLSENFSYVESQLETPDCVVLGFDTELTYQKIVNGINFINNGAPFIATNLDLKCPVGNDSYIPDCGSISKLFMDATGKSPLFLGKPDPRIILDLMNENNVHPSEVLVIGDRLYTDILCGLNAGALTAAVLTGETTLKEIEESTYKPHYILNSISDAIELIKKVSKIG